MSRTPRTFKRLSETNTACSRCDYPVFEGDAAWMTLGGAHTFCSARCADLEVQDLAAVARFVEAESRA